MSVFELKLVCFLWLSLPIQLGLLLKSTFENSSALSTHLSFECFALLIKVIVSYHYLHVVSHHY